ncbi:MAG: hypothetical protein HY299_04120 [Verrucomicrobia bacterium]|nr:hypothetical protein [Verrucomicrobiota bacterium]
MNEPTGLEIPRSLWGRVVAELRNRGQSRRESGAFLLAGTGTSIVSEFVCFDDLDSVALETGIITFHGSGFVNLWNLCRERCLQVLADVHTHPHEWTGQSFSDRTNPMINQPGHVSLIVPDYAQRPQSTLTGVGIHEYLGRHRWKRWLPTGGRVRLSGL